MPAAPVSTRAYPPGLRLAQHAHESAYLCFVREGGFAERYGRRVETFERLTCVYRPPHDEHANTFLDRRTLCLNVDVDAMWLDRLAEVGLGAERFGVRSAPIATLADRLYHELAAPDALSPLVIEALTTEIVVAASRRNDDAHRGSAAWLQRARRLIEEEFASPLSLSTVAAAVGVHPVHLARRFRLAEGCTVGDYIRQVRVRFACEQLASDDAPIAEIALAAGFADQSQLTKSFRRVTGRTPAAYRAAHR